jgi:aminoglycoside phosphotransferase
MLTDVPPVHLAEDLLQAATAAMGGRLRDWSLTQVDHRPSHSTTVTYRTRIAWPDGERSETFGARFGPAVEADRNPPGVLQLSDGTVDAQFWRLRDDPALPALAAACDPSAVRDLLRDSGIDPVLTQLRVLSYRPCRRAVIEVTTPATRLFLKVVRPGRAQAIHDRLALTHAAGLPTPRSLGWSADGLVVSAPLAGYSLRDQLREHGAEACSPDELIDLLRRLPDELAELPRRRSWSASASHYAEVIAAASPTFADRARRLAVNVTSALEDDGAVEPVHGDFYEAQLLAANGRITGLLDIDTAGPGQRVDDLACLVAHLSVLIVMAPQTSAAVRAALVSWLERFDTVVDARQLRVRAAGVALSLATGPYRTQEPDWAAAVADRLDVAEAWFTAADTETFPDFERPLIKTSQPTHQRRRG